MLKPDRIEFFHDIDYTFNMVVERGGIATLVTAGSGGYPGDPNYVATYAANPSGAVPLGMMLYDVITYDTNRQHDNWYKSGFQARIPLSGTLSTKVCLDRGGRYTTNMIPSGVSPSGGQPAYVAASGSISNIQASGAYRCGTWVSSMDQDGYATIQINIA